MALIGMIIIGVMVPGKVPLTLTCVLTISGLLVRKPPVRAYVAITEVAMSPSVFTSGSGFVVGHPRTRCSAVTGVSSISAMETEIENSAGSLNIYVRESHILQGQEGKSGLTEQILEHIEGRCPSSWKSH